MSAPAPRCSTRSGTPALAASVDHPRDESRVLELEVERIERIDVRLRRALDDERVAAVRAAVGKQPSVHLVAVEFESGIAHAFHPRWALLGGPDCGNAPVSARDICLQTGK